MSTKSLLNLDCLRAGSHELIVKLASSANILGTEHRGQAGRSSIEYKNNRGPRMDFCGKLEFLK